MGVSVNTIVTQLGALINMSAMGTVPAAPAAPTVVSDDAVPEIQISRKDDIGDDAMRTEECTCDSNKCNTDTRVGTH